VVELALLVGILIGLTLGFVAGVSIPYQIRLPVKGCKASPNGQHEYAKLQGYYAYCLFCTARKRKT
jgi:hypothetical protein